MQFRAAIAKAHWTAQTAGNRLPPNVLLPDRSPSFPHTAFAVVALFLLALIVRVLPAMEYGRDWYAAGSFTLVNFDEGGSCRAALEGFSYTPFVGRQTLALAALAGEGPPAEIRGDARAAKAYCHGVAHVTVARLYSALCGALTVVVLLLLGRQLMPETPAVAVGGAALLAISGWHIGESMVGTVDAASTLFIYGFLCAGVWAARRGGVRWLLAALLLVPRLFGGLSGRRFVLLSVAYAAIFGLVTNPALAPTPRWLVPMLFWFVVPWRQLPAPGRVLLTLAPFLAPLAMQVEPFVAFTSGELQGRFGTDYGAIGWHKWFRNAVNLPVVLGVGIGIPGLLLALRGLRRLPPPRRAWLVLLPLPVFALYMLFLAPVTYYRHYLPLLPLACLLAALGIASLVYGGLLGEAPIMAVNPHSAAAFLGRGGRIPAPLQSLRN